MIVALHYDIPASGKTDNAFVFKGKRADVFRKTRRQFFYLRRRNKGSLTTVCSPNTPKSTAKHSKLTKDELVNLLTSFRDVLTIGCMDISLKNQRFGNESLAFHGFEGLVLSISVVLQRIRFIEFCLSSMLKEMGEFVKC